MQTNLEGKFRKLTIKSKNPERATTDIVLYPRGVLPKTVVRVAKQTVQLDASTAGPKPLDISKFIKKNNKAANIVKKPRNVRGGKKHQLEKEVKKFKELIEICVTKEEKEKYKILLNRCKHDLNRLRKRKKISNK